MKKIEWLDDLKINDVITVNIKGKNNFRLARVHAVLNRFFTIRYFNPKINAYSSYISSVMLADHDVYLIESREDYYACLI